MASVKFCLFFFYFTLCTFLYDFSEGLRGAHRENHQHVIKVSSLLPVATVCSTPAAPSHAAQLTVAHRSGPCSPLSEKEATIDQILSQDQERVNSIRARLSAGSKQLQPDASLAAASLPAHKGGAFNTENYVVTVGFGTPKNDMTVIFDTGSDLTWIQCEPCAVYCYPQQEKIFDPSHSTSYLNVSCNSAECSQLTSATKKPSGCSSSTCLYAIIYGDNSYSVGFFSHETLTVGSIVFPNFKFGCGQRNRGLFGSTAGLLGLGRDKLSFTSQTAPKFGKVFSYCLPSSTSSTGNLKFGGNQISSRVKYTPLLTDSNNPNFYFLDLIAIVVGGQKLPISASVFSTASTLIDSGTVITRLPPAAYAALRTAFQKYMSKYPPAPALSILDTCYDFSDYNQITVPRIALRFNGGAELDVAFTGILFGSSQSQICLAFAGNSDANDVAIIGNQQQLTFDVVYDVARERVGFGAGGCN